jgi:hypothetical protein
MRADGSWNKAAGWNTLCEDTACKPLNVYLRSIGKNNGQRTKDNGQLTKDQILNIGKRRNQNSTNLVGSPNLPGGRCYIDIENALIERRTCCFRQSDRRFLSPTGT